MSVDYRQSALPPIGFMDRATLKTEEVDYQPRKPILPALATAPTNGYNHPPSYSTLPPPPRAAHNSGTTPSVAFLTGPVGSRRPHVEDNGVSSHQAQSGLSLPSIQEALASDHTQGPSSAISTQSTYPHPSPKSPNFIWKPPHSENSQPGYAASTPQAASRAPYMGHISPATPGPQPAYPHNSYVARTEPTEQFQSRPTEPHPYPNAYRSPRQSSQHRPTQSWPPPIPNQYEPYPQVEESPRQPYPYHQAPSHAMYPPQPNPPPSAGATVAYPTHAPYAVPVEHVPVWQSEEAEISSSENVKRQRGSYADSVKRHLDVFDLESSLDNIANCSKQVFDFSRHYFQRAHQTQRSGPLPGSTPNLLEIDDMVKNGHEIQESLTKLREVIASQQAALAERVKDQYQHKAAKHPASDDGSSYQDGPRDGPDAKKRRGRAAPPGRCHSCNRAETPEWRRGPDGARTLCNACGLHYAKLTRKMNVTKVPIGSSNLGLSQTSPDSPSM